ncbi:hypothetical protein [Actinomadura monticuli]|uniref:Phosphate starvation-inducible protein PsiF n=1 Tax=Actinomadura monticuli TaxID=3097367 RepID=A0ABV4QBY4_9ACTN
MLALTLALGGCGGSDDGGTDSGGSAPSSPGASAPSGTSTAKGITGTPTPPAESKVTKKFNDCMTDQGVRLPSPNPSTTPAKKDLEKMKAALKTCMRKLQPPASSNPG